MDLQINDFAIYLLKMVISIDDVSLAEAILFYTSLFSQETIQEAERCLPVKGGATTLGPLRLTGSYHNDTRLHSLVVGNISWPSIPEELDKERRPDGPMLKCPVGCKLRMVDEY